LVAAVVAGIVGGAVGARLANNGQILAAGNAGAQAAVAPQAAAVDWAAHGKRWQDQYLAMYPPKLDPILVQSGIEWQRQYEQQHPQR
jgi:hypothetical protein